MDRIISLCLTLGRTSQREGVMPKTVANKLGLYVVNPDRIGAAPERPKDAKSNESQKSYYTRKYMELHAAKYKLGDKK